MALLIIFADLPFNTALQHLIVGVKRHFYLHSCSGLFRAVNNSKLILRVPSGIWGCLKCEKHPLVSVCLHLHTFSNLKYSGISLNKLSIQGTSISRTCPKQALLLCSRSILRKPLHSGHFQRSQCVHYRELAHSDAVNVYLKL